MNSADAYRSDDDLSQTLDDPRVLAAVEEYLAAAQNGHKPERREFLARYLDIAPALAEALDGLDFVQQAAPQLHEQARVADVVDTAAFPDEMLLSAPLGDYRLVREVGRGGMGIVYEAEQLSLGRRVALKVLSLAATLDPKQLQRFRNEAQAAAFLRHPHIPAIHGVGCERGVHFYVMDYIEGQTLATIIRGLRHQTGLEKSSPSLGTQPIAGLSTEPVSRNRAFFRTVASLAIQAADALSHAHVQGVLHRDIKPSNLLLDGAGQLWVTDFGLARMLHAPGLTMTGEILGTLRYMSPEQAVGRQELVDQRTDIYSLGITLYEALALEPAFSGRDRQELMRQIASEEPRPLRKLNPAVPAELETILLKAMAKEPAERYASAQELGEDLGRFLADKPVLARRPSIFQRLVKWTRRHRGVVWTAVGLLVLAVIGLTYSTARISREETRARTAYEAAQRQQLRAEANFSKALAAVDDLLSRFGNARYAREQKIEPLRREMFEQALVFFQGLLHQGSTEPGERFETGQALTRMARIQVALGRADQPEQTALRGLEILDGLSVEFPDDPRYQNERAAGHYWLSAYLCSAPGRQPDVADHLRQAITQWEQLAALSASYPSQLFEAYHGLGYLLQSDPRRLREAEDTYRRCLQILEQEKESPSHAAIHSKVHNSLGLLLRLRGRPQEAVSAHERALEILAPLCEEASARQEEYRYERARAHNHLALAFWQLDRRDEAESYARKALTSLRGLADISLSSEARRELVATYRNLGRMLEETGRGQEAEAAYRDGLKLAEVMASESPVSSDAERNLASACLYLGRRLLADGKASEAATLARRLEEFHPSSVIGLNHQAWLLATFPEARLRNPARSVILAREAVERAPQDGTIWNTLGVAHYRSGDYRAAVNALEKSMQLRQGGDPNDWFFLALARWQLGEPQDALRWYNQAVAWMEKNNSRSEELRGFRSEAATVLGVADAGLPPKTESRAKIVKP